ncbi:response regulator [Halobacillus seohaensis]|uniref:Response regulator n=1 Tax=Halobacillus seohaensis TaxID=447421 RepID=A0ABW2ENE8_9BACI
MTKVVIAEDDYRVAQLHESFLMKLENVQVVGKALNAAETMQAVEQHQPDLLLLDVYMPDQLGTDLLHQLREHSTSLDVIMITAADDKEMVTQALNYGVVDYIIKPISMDRFVETIKNYQAKKRLIDSHETMDQKLVDQLIGKEQTQYEGEVLPKGIDSLTLSKVRKLLQHSGDTGVTAELAGEHMGASKTTARRYLEYLISTHEGIAEMRYGKVGRPERKYFYSKN